MLTAQAHSCARACGMRDLFSRIPTARLACAERHWGTQRLTQTSAHRHPQWLRSALNELNLRESAACEYVVPGQLTGPTWRFAASASIPAAPRPELHMFAVTVERQPDSAWRSWFKSKRQHANTLRGVVTSRQIDVRVCAV